MVRQYYGVCVRSAKEVNGNVIVKNEILDNVDTTLVDLDLTLDAKLRWNSLITRLAKRLCSAAYALFSVF
ncbi:hypothetical protein EVAR_59054_1 [Eumeta japonica]|uniref:Uncharacterized protein n=1 Tax=Eumeta variegata TaxID=151549 RepID=A0A4C1YFP0_EUMVA|nr:hypothetical protein EVAR_59054_1 [Eumeta japonica]